MFIHLFRCILVIVSDLEIAIASPSFASLFNFSCPTTSNKNSSWKCKVYFLWNASTARIILQQRVDVAEHYVVIGDSHIVQWLTCHWNIWSSRTALGWHWWPCESSSTAKTGKASVLQIAHVTCPLDIVQSSTVSLFQVQQNVQLRVWERFQKKKEANTC